LRIFKINVEYMGEGVCNDISVVPLWQITAVLLTVWIIPWSDNRPLSHSLHHYVDPNQPKVS